MQLSIVSYEHLLQTLQQLPVADRQRPITGWGPGIGVNIVALEIVDEDHIDPAGTGAIPVSEYDGLMQNPPVVVSKGEIKLIVEISQYHEE